MTALESHHLEFSARVLFTAASRSAAPRACRGAVGRAFVLEPTRPRSGVLDRRGRALATEHREGLLRAGRAERLMVCPRVFRLVEHDRSALRSICALMAAVPFGFTPTAPRGGRYRSAALTARLELTSPLMNVRRPITR
jgi:hypothetical protein